MQAIWQGGPVIGVSCQDGAVYLCVCVVHVPGWLPSYRVAHIKVPDETNAGRNGFGVAPGQEVKAKAGLGRPWPELNLEQEQENK